MNKPILILSPTELEISAFREFCASSDEFSHCVVEICGIGAAETAANTASAIIAHEPRIVILTGIAGAYCESGLSIGESVLVERETIADMGAFRATGFRPMFAKEYRCPLIEVHSRNPGHSEHRFETFTRVYSNSVNSCAAPYIEPQEGYEIENMEGAAFFAICTALDTPFLELRTVSNVVGTDPKEWDIPLASKLLSAKLIDLINEINS